jgi:hypothetical protein
MTGRTASFAHPLCKLSAAKMGAGPHCQNQHGAVPVVPIPWARAVCPRDEQGVPGPNGGHHCWGRGADNPAGVPLKSYRDGAIAVTQWTSDQ